MKTEFYETKIKKLSGTSYDEVYPQAISIYKRLASKTKRRPYLRSKYFNKEKIFLDYFWIHIREKNIGDRTRRLNYYGCALDLVKNSSIDPVSKLNPKKSSETLHRFFGKTKSGDIFCVQVVENIKNKNRYLISVFPYDIK
jgi:hypothetical protein